jgi:sortase A
LYSSVRHFAQRLFLWLGLALLICAGGTAAYSGIYQQYQSWKFERARVSAKARNVAQSAAAPKLSEAPALDEPAGLREGDVVGKLDIPRIGISVIILQGIEANLLILGAGHVPGTPLPGSDGNVAIAAHRDTFFRGLKAILVDDRIQFATVHGTYEYVVDSTEIVDPEDTRVMESRGRSELTLITCYPFYFVGAAPKRFVVHARPMTSAPANQGDGAPHPPETNAAIKETLNSNRR